MFMTFFSVVKAILPFIWEVAFGKRTFRQGFRYNWRLALILLLFLISITLNVHLLRSAVIHETYYLKKINKLNETIVALRTKQTTSIPRISPPNDQTGAELSKRGRPPKPSVANTVPSETVSRANDARTRLERIEHRERTYNNTEGQK